MTSSMIEKFCKDELCAYVPEYCAPAVSGLNSSLQIFKITLITTLGIFILCKVIYAGLGSIKRVRQFRSYRSDQIKILTQPFSQSESTSSLDDAYSAMERGKRLKRPGGINRNHLFNEANTTIGFTILMVCLIYGISKAQGLATNETCHTIEKDLYKICKNALESFVGATQLALPD